MVQGQPFCPNHDNPPRMGPVISNPMKVPGEGRDMFSVIFEFKFRLHMRTGWFYIIERVVGQFFIDLIYPPLENKKFLFSDLKYGQVTRGDSGIHEVGVGQKDVILSKCGVRDSTKTMTMTTTVNKQSFFNDLGFTCEISLFIIR